MENKITIRFANEVDVPLILKFIRELAEYEKLLNEVLATEEQLKKTLFGDKTYAEVLIAELDQQAVGFALFFHNYSTFLSKPGIYLEDLFVLPQARGKGIGKAMLKYLAKLALDRQCGRLEWWVLDWNQEAIEFYHRLGSEAMSDWTVHRVTGSALINLAENSK